MKSILLKWMIPFLVFTLQACDKADPIPEDVFHVTFVGPSDGCPGGPLVYVQKDDVNRLGRLLGVAFNNDHDTQQVISAVNLKGSYRKTQRLIIKIRKFTPEETVICTANLPWYPGAYVVEEYAD